MVGELYVQFSARFRFGWRYRDGRTDGRTTGRDAAVFEASTGTGLSIVDPLAGVVPAAAAATE